MPAQEQSPHQVDLTSCGLNPFRTRSSAAGRAQPAEDVTPVVWCGDRYDLVPSGGTAYVFGAGSVLHHRRDCSEGSQLPDDRVFLVPDPRGDLWRRVLELSVARRRGLASLDVARQPVTDACPGCALRPAAA